MRYLFPIFAFVGVLFVEQRAEAYCRTTTCDAKSLNSSLCETDLNGCAARGVPLYWPTRCIPMASQAVGSDILGYSAEALHEAVLSAAGNWANVSCAGLPPSMLFMDAGPVECGDVEYNANGPNANIVMVRDSAWRHQPNALGVTTVTFRSKTGEILNADMELNSELISSMGLTSELDYIVTHELGHVLGLSHTRDATAIMYDSYVSARSVTGPAEDDVNGVCGIYTPGREVPECDPLKNFDTRCGGNVQGACSVSNASSRSNAGMLGFVSLGVALCWALRGLVLRKRR